MPLEQVSGQLAIAKPRDFERNTAGPGNECPLPAAIKMSLAAIYAFTGLGASTVSSLGLEDLVKYILNHERHCAFVFIRSRNWSSDMVIV